MRELAYRRPVRKTPHRARAERNALNTERKSESGAKVLRWLVYPLVFLSPFGETVLSIPFAGFQLSLFRVLAALTFFAFITRWSNATIIPRSRSGYSIVFYMAWLAYALTTGLWALDYLRWFKYIFFIATGLMVALSMNAYLTKREFVEKALLALFAGFVVQSIVGWYEVSTQTLVIGAQERIELYESRRVFYPCAFSGHPNSLAMMMMFASGISLYFVRKTRSMAVKAALTVIAIECAALILQTTSRGAFIGLAIFLACYLLLSGHKYLTAFVAVIALVVLGPYFLEFANTYLAFHFDWNAGGSDVIRWNLIRNGLVLLSNTFGFGVGAGQIESNMIAFATYPTFGIINMHNWWMEILVGFGILIFIGYLVFYGRLLNDFIKTFKTSTHAEERELAKFGIAIMAGFVIASISASSNMVCDWLWVFWGILIGWQGNCSILTSVAKPHAQGRDE